MKRFLPLLLLLCTPAFATVPLTMTIDQHGVGLTDTGSSTQTFTASCTYPGGSPAPDNCTAAGAITWASHGYTDVSGGPNVPSTSMTGNVLTWLATVNGTNYQHGTFMATSDVTATVTGACNGSATVCTDFAVVQGQHNGDAWNIYVTPGVQIFNNIGTPPLNVVVGSAVQLGCGYTLNGGSSANPCQTCNWSDNNGHFSIDRNGKATAVSAGSTTFTCGGNGNAVVSGGSPTETLIAVTVSNPTPKTYHVHDIGGTAYSATNTAGQCNGLFDVVYPGSGTNRDCAWADYEYAYFDQVTHLQALWLINGGDTIILHKPTIGGTYHAALTNQASYVPTNCVDNQVYNGCPTPNIPSGPDAAHPTRILGENWANCSTANGPDQTKTTPLTLWGRAALTTQLSQNVDIECLALSDDGTLHAGNGVWESALTANVTYKNVSTINTFTGIWGPMGIGVVFDHLLVYLDPNFGINMDDTPSWAGGGCSAGCGNISAAGDFTLLNSSVIGTGCYSFTAGACFDTGSPDGIGDGNIVGNVTLDNDIIAYNLQDGLDVLHAVLQSATITNSQFYGNVGQQAKVGPSQATTMRNNTFIGNCNRLKEPFSGVTYADGTVSPCRGSGGVVNPAIGGGGVYNFQSNTIVGIGNVMFLQGCAYGWECFPTASINWQDNVLLGYTGTASAYGSGTQAPTFGTTNINTVFNHNCYYNTTNNGTLGSGDITTDCGLTGEVAAPVLTPLVGAGESVLDGFNFLPGSSANAKWTGTTYTGQLSTAQNGVTWHSPPSMGAFELGGSSNTIKFSGHVTASGNVVLK